MTMGFLLDTHVLSEVMRENPATKVMTWLDAQPESLLHTSTVTQAEVLAGIAYLPPGKRRDALASSAEQLFQLDFSGRCLVFGVWQCSCRTIRMGSRSAKNGGQSHQHRRRPNCRHCLDQPTDACHPKYQRLSRHSGHSSHQPLATALTKAQANISHLQRKCNI